MPSPFPGMDPYLEDPALWPDFHSAFAGELRVALNAILPPSYYARTESRPEVGIIDDDENRRKIIPDVSIHRTRRSDPAISSSDATRGTVAVAEPRVEPSASFRVKYPDEQIRHLFVEIRDSRQGHSLVTLIEIVSPSNKRAGDDRKAYRKKQQEILESDASLVEIDLHSTGDAVVAAPISTWPKSRWSRYLVCVSRAWEREAGPEYEVYPIDLPDPLPCVLIPLRDGEKELPLDLQFVFHRAYDGGPYRRGAVEYEQPPPAVPLTADELAWVRERVVVAFPNAAEGRS